MDGHENLIPIKDTEIARELQGKSVKKRKENQEKKRIFESMIRERLKDKDLQEIVDNLINRAKRNEKSIEVLRDTLGEKPTEHHEIEADVNMSYEEYLKKAEDKDGY